MRTALTSFLAASLFFASSGSADSLGAREIKNSLGMKLVYIPPGKFTMGSPESEVGREAQETQHEVELTKGFYMGVCEVTVGQFKQFVTATKFRTDGERDGKGAYGIDAEGKIKDMKPEFTWKNPGFEQTDERPVVNVSWSDAKAFCKWLSEKEKKIYRIATIGNGADAAARAKYPDWSIGIKAKDGYVFTAPVGQFKANAFCLYDMHGNVWEWCEDWYVPNSDFSEKRVDPTGPTTGKSKVQRGGGWSSDAKRLRSSARNGRDPVTYRGCYQGFRVVLEQVDERSAKEPLRVQTQGNSWSYNVSRLQALLALSRSTDGANTIQPALLAALDRFEFAKLSEDEQCWYLRILTISASRHGIYSREDAARLVRKLTAFLPSSDRRINEELAARFAALQYEGYLVPTLDLFERNRSQEEQIHYAGVLLRDPKSGVWTPALRERFFNLAAERLLRWKGNAFVNPKREAVLKGLVAMLDDEQRKKFGEQIAGLQKPFVSVLAKKRELVQQWVLEDLTPSLDPGLKEKRDLENGRARFKAANCFTCHSFQGDGGLARPDLTNLRGRSTAAELLDRILSPSKNINEQYAQLVYKLKNGKQVVGRVIETTDDAIVVGTNPQTRSPTMFASAKRTSRASLRRLCRQCRKAC